MNRWIISLFSCSSLFADVTYNVIVDRYLSPYIGADDLLSTYQAVEELEKWIFPPPAVPQRNFMSDAKRFSDLLLIWEPINYTTLVTQHEFFGHGFRVRTMPHDVAHVSKYKFGPPPPYGSGGGATEYRVNPTKLTAYEELAIIGGGVEATAILANRLKLHWLQRGTLDPRQASLYLYSEQDITIYALASEEDSEEGNDITAYVHLLNKTYPNGHLTVKSLRKQAYTNLADPFTLYSIYGCLYYIFTGLQGPIPMIPAGSYQYLPGARMGLTPFGPEYYFENFLVKARQPIYFYLRYGEFAHENYWGFGIEHGYLWNINSTPWGFRLDVWRQPHTDFENTNYSYINVEEGLRKQPHDPHFGIALTLIGHIKLWSNGSFYFQLGGKTSGYLPGEPLQPSVIARVGFTLS